METTLAKLVLLQTWKELQLLFLVSIALSHQCQAMILWLQKKSTQQSTKSLKKTCQIIMILTFCFGEKLFKIFHISESWIIISFKSWYTNFTQKDMKLVLWLFSEVMKLIKFTCWKLDALLWRFQLITKARALRMKKTIYKKIAFI